MPGFLRWIRSCGKVISLKPIVRSTLHFDLFMNAPTLPATLLLAFRALSTRSVLAWEMIDKTTRPDWRALPPRHKTGYESRLTSNEHLSNQHPIEFHCRPHTSRTGPPSCSSRLSSCSDPGWIRLGTEAFRLSIQGSRLSTSCVTRRRLRPNGHVYSAEATAVTTTIRVARRRYGEFHSQRNGMGNFLRYDQFAIGCCKSLSALPTGWMEERNGVLPLRL